MRSDERTCIVCGKTGKSYNPYTGNIETDFRIHEYWDWENINPKNGSCCYYASFCPEHYREVTNRRTKLSKQYPDRITADRALNRKHGSGVNNQHRNRCSTCNDLGHNRRNCPKKEVNE